MNLKREHENTTRGWLFDVYPSPKGMVLWVITAEGKRLKLLDTFYPSFYCDGPSGEIKRVFSLLSREPIPVTAEQVERFDLFLNKSIPVIQVTPKDLTQYSGLVKKIARMSDTINLYNCDISLAQLYFYEKKLFPLAFCSMAYNRAGKILSIKALDSPWDLDYTLPPLERISLKLEGELINPNHGWRGKLEVFDGETSRLLEADDPKEFIELLNRYIQRKDPDLILTDWGDSFIVPHLRRLAEKVKTPLALNRDLNMEVSGRKARSYASYGRMVYNAGAQIFYGRWHIDRQNSFILHEADLEGLFEQARVCKLPIQHMARTSSGTGITSMQLETAYHEHILIPWKKKEPEQFKTALELLNIDKGGLVFLPPVGFYEEVAELDFSSMYPSIMSKFNISPETVGCTCCPENRVPETGYTLCTRKVGLVPKTLRPLLDKRARYKKDLASTHDPKQKESIDRRQTALKWLLVVSFGYLGYKNARFGKIEAHECVTAYSREILLQTKEIAEGEGYRLIHAIVDSVWLKKEGAAEQDYQMLARKISKKTGLLINLEGIYRWIGFLPSKTKPTLSVPNRFWGVFHSGKIKIRGLEVRRSDSPPFIKEAQNQMIAVLSEAKNINDYQTRIPFVLEILAVYRLRLEEGQIPLRDLVMTRNISQDPRDYQKATPSAVVAQELLARGIKLGPGESIQYIITRSKDKDPASRARAYANFTTDHVYDLEKYTELLLKGGEGLLSLFGYDLKKLDGLTSKRNGGRSLKVFN